MTSFSFRWKRFCYPRGKRLNFTEEGYPYDPDSEFGEYYNPDLVTLNSLVMGPCTVLLGEPGIGKSWAMRDMRSRLDDIVSNQEGYGNLTLSVDLRAYGNEIRLIENLFEDEAFSSWIEGKNSLHIFLDSLDECLLQINHVAALLVDEFRKRARNRIEGLFLHIACRTAVWPMILEKGLKELFGEDSVGVFELAPLRRVDVEEAATVSGLDSNEFLQAINRVEAVPLAIRPVTLRFLLNTYKKNKIISLNKVGLYSEGCRRLCEETSESRRAAGRVGVLTANQRMILSSRIAAAIVFSNKYAVSTDVDFGDALLEDISISALIGNESLLGGQMQADITTLKETLDTGLFSSRGQERIGWAHQSYAEFLAARYLVEHKMSPTQIMSLLVHPSDPDGKLVPQLLETAAWVASMEPEVFHKIVKTDPVILLRADIAATDGKSRAEIVESLLRQVEDKNVRISDLRGNRLAKLAHQDLANQILPYICDRASFLLNCFV